MYPDFKKMYPQGYTFCFRYIFSNNFMSNDLPKVIIENDVISFENSET